MNANLINVLFLFFCFFLGGQGKRMWSINLLLTGSCSLACVCVGFLIDSGTCLLYRFVHYEGYILTTFGFCLFLLNCVPCSFFYFFFFFYFYF